MAKNIHEVLDGLQVQSTAESVLYSVDTEPWGGTPTSPSVDVFDEEDLATSVKTTVMPSGNPSVLTDDIILPALTSLTAGIIYRILLTFESAGNTLQGYIRVQAK